jgi:broad specificity phosphatase PhoE
MSTPAEIATRLLLLRHAPTAATRAGMFPADEPLDEEARRQAAAAQTMVEGADRVLCSPSLRTQQTAEALGLEPGIVPELSECNFGDWAGLTIDEVRSRFADKIESWLSDPSSAPHGGETLADVALRVRAFLDRARTFPGTTLAITHGGVIRVAIIVASDLPLERVWTVNVEPLSLTELRFDGDGWRHVNT